MLVAAALPMARHPDQGIRTMSSPDPAVVTERIGAVCRLTLNRPERHNPLTPRCIREILDGVGRRPKATPASGRW